MMNMCTGSIEFQRKLPTQRFSQWPSSHSYYWVLHSLISFLSIFNDSKLCSACPLKRQSSPTWSPTLCWPSFAFSCSAIYAFPTLQGERERLRDEASRRINFKLSSNTLALCCIVYLGLAEITHSFMDMHVMFISWWFVPFMVTEYSAVD